MPFNAEPRLDAGYEDAIDELLFEEGKLKVASPLKKPDFQPEPYRSYAEYVEYASAQHRHLVCLLDFLKYRAPGTTREYQEPSESVAESKNRQQRMTIIDVEKITESTVRTTSYRSDIGGEGHTRDFPQELLITPENIKLLGEVFDIDPEFFYGHLEAQAWKYRGWEKVPDYSISRSNRFRKKRFFHLDFDELEFLEMHESASWWNVSVTAERRTSMLKIFISRLSERIAATMDIVPKMKLLYNNGIAMAEWPAFTCRNRISLLSCMFQGVKTDIILLYPTVASRKYAYPTPLFPSVADTVYSESLLSQQRLPPYSAGKCGPIVPPKGIAARLDYFIRKLYRDVTEEAVTSCSPTLCIYTIASSEWVVTLGHLDHLIDTFENDVSLLVPNKGDEHCISLAETRKLLFEYLDILSDTLRMLRHELHQESTPDIEASIRELVDDFEGYLELVKRLADRADKAITTHNGFMAIEESRKAIAQAEQVRRLTNLAFIFLPLSLTTSIFGMNIYELSPDSHLWMVVVTGVVVTVLAVTAAIQWDLVVWLIFSCWYSLQWPMEMLLRGWWLWSEGRKEAQRKGRRDTGLEGKQFLPPVVGLREFLREKDCQYA